ncbi:MAG: PKD domain-containing protein [Lewinellaceae bacterium]|nr:PKD domain-containing protein [Lewinellaceae bacterium]
MYFLLVKGNDTTLGSRRVVIMAQEYDNTWLLGYAGGSTSSEDSTYGISILSFWENSGPTIINNQTSEIDFFETNASISDAAGNYLFAFNGQYIEDASDHKMLNGDHINPYDSDDIGYTLPQGGIILPWPEDSNRYVLFHQVKAYGSGGSLFGGDLRYTIVDKRLNGGLGGVTQKRVLVLEGPLSYGQLTATRHANGRDWWLLAGREESNEYYRILLAPEGVFNLGIQAIGSEVESGLGQACFSPDGQWYVRYSTINNIVGDFVNIYAFDRCTGLLSNHLEINYFDDSHSGGVAISPNSRYLYVSSYLYVYQYDLWASDLEASRDTVAVYDGFRDPFATRFYLAQLAPNGKIYVTAPNSTNYLHVIHRPDEPGQACQAEQHGLRLPTRHGASMPNFPTYRLGPIDGSPCGTLGIDNLPVRLSSRRSLARWRYGQDTLEPLQVAFTDLSAYEPAEWHWDFGDGSTSQDTSPVHVFLEDGRYEVCLTVSNANGSDTKCRELQLGVVSEAGQVWGLKFEVQVFPNPFGERFTVALPAGWLPQQARLLLYDGLRADPCRPAAQQAGAASVPIPACKAAPCGRQACSIKSPHTRINIFT